MVSSGRGIGRVTQLTELSRVVGLWNIEVLLQARKIMDVKLDNILLPLLRRCLTGNLRFRLRPLKLIVVDSESEFFCHKLCQIDRETICIV